MFLGYIVLQLFCRYNLWNVHVMSRPTLNVLYFSISTFRSTCAVPNMAVVSSALISCFPGMLLSHLLNDFRWPKLPLLLLVSLSFFFFFAFHVRCISVVRSLYFETISASFLITFLSPEIVVPVNRHVGRFHPVIGHEGP
jgi:hypothetical protein